VSLRKTVWDALTLNLLLSKATSLKSFERGIILNIVIELAYN
jgi:hypothetical protein